MYKLTAMYPNRPDVHFDFDYYTNTHDHLVRECLAPHGLTRIDVDRGVGTPGGSEAPYIAVGTLWFTSAEGIEAGLAEHGDEILGDIPNFSSVEPEIQISQVIVDDVDT